MFEIIAVAVQGVFVLLMRQVIKQSTCMVKRCNDTGCECDLRQLIKKRSSERKMKTDSSEESR